MTSDLVRDDLGVAAFPLNLPTLFFSLLYESHHLRLSPQTAWLNDDREVQQQDGDMNKCESILSFGLVHMLKVVFGSQRGGGGGITLSQVIDTRTARLGSVCDP